MIPVEIKTITFFTCNKCETEKPVSDFPILKPSKNHRTKRGFQGICKKCKSEWMREDRIKNPLRYKDTDLKSLYGISLEKYEIMFQKQNGLCAICFRTGNYKNRNRLFVDHDHTSGVVRGLLCGSCNSAIGLFGEEICNFINAIKYLKDRKK